ncbi:MAG: FeoA family protein [Bacillota bacterium]
MQLTQLPIGASGVVVALKASGEERRRTLDLGLIPGTKVTAKLQSPSGDPTAFLIRGATIALRSEEAAAIMIEEAQDN